MKIEELGKREVVLSLSKEEIHYIKATVVHTLQDLSDNEFARRTGLECAAARNICDEFAHLYRTLKRTDSNDAIRKVPVGELDLFLRSTREILHEYGEDEHSTKLGFSRREGEQIMSDLCQVQDAMERQSDTARKGAN